MSEFSEFFLNSPASVVELELMEISHPAFTQTYRRVRNAVEGVTVTIDGSPEVFDYWPMRISRSDSRDNLDHQLRIDVGDLGTVLPQELDAVEAADAYQTKPVVRYWLFRSDDLATPLYGPILLEVPSFSFKREGASFIARAPQLNNSTTGERYTFDRFFMLRGFL